MARSRPPAFAFLLFAALLLALPAGTARAQNGGEGASIAVLEAVVRVTAAVPGDARSAQTLGTERDGSGVVIDGEGLVLTIGYLILEATSAEITLAGGKRVPAQPIAYDHESGFGLLRASEKLAVPPMALGNSAGVKPQDRVLVASHGGAEMAGGAVVVTRRPFAGSWEYLLEQAIFTTPPHPAFGGAALIGADGGLLGIGSLAVGDAAGADQPLPGNMFVPIDLLKPILADMLEHGRAQGPGRPWLGLSSEEVHGRLFVTRVSRGGPAFKAGIEPGDLVVGVNGAAVENLADLYRKVRAVGKAGAEIPLDVLQGMAVKRVRVKSIDRHDWLKTRSSY
ncbi:MAG: PDZ domain-containing protein [Alphaproteobacteria bacterium]|nr:PDZ domain-containing protein [Alphaproteobacteria bacterium]